MLIWFNGISNLVVYLMLNPRIICISWPAVVEGDPKAPFSIATIGDGTVPFPGLLHFTLDTYLIMLSVRQRDIKYHFLSLWYDST